MNKDKMIKWIACRNVGLSSRTMWGALMGTKCDGSDYPRDVDDFSRCYSLYVFCEVTKEDLERVVSIYPYWKPIVEHWDELCSMYEKRDYGGIYKALSSMREKIMELKNLDNVGLK